LWIYGALLALIFTAETAWNSLSRASSALSGRGPRYISLKTVIDRSFGGLLALLGIKIAAT
jgi:threonine/homoserine/homoserine lactone efflux protein